MGLAIVAGGAVVATASTRRVNAFIHSPYFKIRSVRIYGLSSDLNRELSRQDFFRGLEGQNLLFLDADSLAQRLNRFPKITEAAVVKRYPDSLLITARQRRPAAYLNAGTIYCIDREGVLLAEAPAASPRGEDLPFISGLKARAVALGDRIESRGLERSLDILGRLGQMNPHLYAQVGEIHVDENDGLTLFLRGGLEARLGAADPLERLPALERFLDTHPNLEDLTYVDLRFDRQIVYF